VKWFAVLVLLILLLPTVSAQVVVFGGTITVLPEAVPTVRNGTRFFEADFPTFYGPARTRALSKPSNFFYNVYLSSFSVRKGGGITMVFTNVAPMGCFLDSTNVPLYVDRYGRFGSFSAMGSDFWVTYSKASGRWLYNVTFEHDSGAHTCGLLFSNPAQFVPFASRARPLPWGLVGASILVLTTASMGGFMLVRWRLRRYGLR